MYMQIGGALKWVLKKLGENRIRQIPDSFQGGGLLNSGTNVWVLKGERIRWPAEPAKHLLASGGLCYLYDVKF